MEIDLKQFANINKRIIIWTIFFALLYLLRHLFGLLFLTFILSFIFFNIIHWLDAKTPFSRRLITAIIYLIFLFILTTLVIYVVPRLGTESRIFIQQLPETIEKAQQYLDKQASQQEPFAPIILRLKESFTLEALGGLNQEKILGTVVTFFNSVTTFISYFLVAILLSFLILFDYPKLRKKTLALKDSKLQEIYEETGDSVVHFAIVVGETFQAQILVACLNTIFTAIGLYALDIHPIIVLATIVFFAGLIPVLGTFISSVPIMLFAFNAGGLERVLYVLVLIILIHTIEAYILNPRILSAVLRINPVIILMILYIGGSLFGLWGVLLGVPVAVYVYRFAIQSPDDQEAAAVG